MPRYVESTRKHSIMLKKEAKVSFFHLKRPFFNIFFDKSKINKNICVYLDFKRLSAAAEKKNDNF